MKFIVLFSLLCGNVFALFPNQYKHDSLKDSFINIENYLPKDRSKENAEKITNAINNLLKDVAGDSNNEKLKPLRRINPRTIYFPPGTYYINKTLGALIKPPTGNRPEEYSCSLRLVGAGPDLTTIKLVDNLATFKKDKRYKYMIQTGNDLRLNPSYANSAYGNYIEGMTLDIGNNINAGGIGFNVANMGSINNVKIISNNSRKAISSGIYISDFSGPGLVKKTTISGFKQAISFDLTTPKNNIVLSEINIDNADVGVVLHRKQVQMEYMNIKNTRQPFQIKNIYNTSILTHSLILNDGSSNYPAVISGKAQAFLYAKDITYKGYDQFYTDEKHSIKGHTDKSLSKIYEWTNHPYKLGKQTLQNKNDKKYYGQSLENKKAPIFPAGKYLSENDYVYVTDYGAKSGDGVDDSEAFQKAIDSGKKILIIPYGEYKIEKDIFIRKNIIKADFLFSDLTGKGKIFVNQNNINKSESENIFLSNIITAGNMDYGDHIHLIHNSDKNLVLENVRIGVIGTGSNVSGDLYIDNIGPRTMLNLRRPIYAKLRQYNREIAWWGNEGGKLYIIGDNVEGKDKRYHTDYNSNVWNTEDKEAEQNWTYPFQKTSTTFGGGTSVVMGGAIDPMDYLTYDTFRPNATYMIITNLGDAKASSGHIVYSGFAAPSYQFGAEKKLQKTGGTGSFEAHIYELDRINFNFVFINDSDIIKVPYQSGLRVQIPLYHSR